MRSESINLGSWLWLLLAQQLQHTIIHEQQLYLLIKDRAGQHHVQHGPRPVAAIRGLPADKGQDT